MAEAQQGSTVKIHYTGKYEDGTVFDSSLEREPMEFTIGAGLTIPGFDEAAVGMAPGDTKSVTIPPEKAFGDHAEEMVQDVPRDQLPGDLELALGGVLEVTSPEGESYNVRVVKLDDETVTLDANHPLAGETLCFDLEMVEVSDPE